MDRKKEIIRIRVFEALSLIFCLTFGFISHFLYEWSGEMVWLKPLVPINESVWEHGKLLFMPFFFWGMIEYFFIMRNKNYIVAKSIPLILSVPLMIMLFYTYTSFTGDNILAVDITISVLIILFMNIYSFATLIHPPYKYKHWWLLIFVIAIFVLFIVFTYYPPNNKLFISKA